MVDARSLMAQPTGAACSRLAIKTSVTANRRSACIFISQGYRDTCAQVRQGASLGYEGGIEGSESASEREHSRAEPNRAEPFGVDILLALP
jgi:hypothetical protein